MNTPEPTNGVIGVHIGNSELMKFMPPDLMPNGNWIGMIILKRFFELALSQDGPIHNKTVQADGPLNDCILGLDVASEITAIEIIKNELRRLQLLDLSQIGIWRDDEWRCVFPSEHVRMNHLMDADRQGLALQQAADSSAVEQTQIRKDLRQWMEEVTALKGEVDRLSKQKSAANRLKLYTAFLLVAASVGALASLVHWSVVLCVAVYVLIAFVIEIRKQRYQ